MRGTELMTASGSDGCAGEFEAPLALLRQQVATSDLLPKGYELYRPLLADALCFFLRRLSPSRLRAIFTEQLRLPWTVPTAERVVSLLVHLPALHKLGQVVARDDRLTLSFRHELQRLESLAPQIPTNRVLRLLDKELRNWRKIGIEPGPRPLAEGSVGVVLPFEWRAGTTDLRHGVFKLLKPGVRRKLEEDLEILSRLGGFLDEDCTRLGLPSLDYRDTFETIRELLLHEVRFEEEQRNLAEAHEIYRSLKGVIVPRLFPFCSSNLTAMERIAGRRIPKAEGTLGQDRLREPIARLMIQALVAEPILSSKQAALFHADPHAGNLLVTPAGELAVLDWSLSGRLPKRERVELVQVVLGALMLDSPGMVRHLERLSHRETDPLALKRIAHSSLRELTRGRFPGITWLMRLLDRLVLEAGLRPDPNLLLFRKSLLTIAGVVADLTRTGSPARDRLVDESFLRAFVDHWMAEWPSRFGAFLHDRSFGTHLAATDLLQLMCATPLIYARWWNEAGRFLIDRVSNR